MTGTPTRVALYELISDNWERSAVFELVDGTTVALTVFGDEECVTAADWFADGVPVLGSPARVGADAGPEFMRALLQPFRSTYRRLVDESVSTAPE